VGKAFLRPANYHVDIVINRFGKTLIDERLMDDKYKKTYGRDDDYAFDRDGTYNNNDHNRDDRDRDNRDARNNYDTRPAEPIKDQAFASLVETLRKESFETTKASLIWRNICTG
jgi:hypothetical protein